MAGSPTEAASAAIERLHALREQAKDRRERVKGAVRQVRERNRDESLQTMLRVRAARRRGPAWPTEPPEPPQMHLYETDDLEPPARQDGRSAPAGPRRPAPVDEDDWSNETWLH